MPPDEFHLFLALPPEIQDSIWELCLPRRIISPLYTPTVQESLGRIPGTRHRTDLPVRALIPFRPPLISRVCSRARATALRRGQYTPISIKEGANLVSGGSIWLNEKSDWVYLDYMIMMDGLDDSGTAPRVFELARDVGVPLLIDSTIQGDHENGLHNMSQEEETVGSRLYKSFLRGREHFYHVMAEVTLVVTGKGREHVVDTGLFGLLGEDTAVVPTEDKERLQQYKSLYDMYDAREGRDPVIENMQNTLNSLIQGEDQGKREPRFLIGELLERICAEEGEFDISAEDMTHEDGSLKLEHPLVEKLGISMPTCEKVVIFELRRLDTLLKDSLNRITCVSTDTTDATDTTDSTDAGDTESDEA